MNIGNISILKAYQYKLYKQFTSKAEQEKRNAAITALVNKSRSGQKLSPAEMAQLREMSPGTADSISNCEKVRQDRLELDREIKLRIEARRIKKRKDEKIRTKHLNEIQSDKRKRDKLKEQYRQNMLGLSLSTLMKDPNVSYAKLMRHKKRESTSETATYTRPLPHNASLTAPHKSAKTRIEIASPDETPVRTSSSPLVRMGTKRKRDSFER